jgi:hypothetical protein
LISVTVLLFKIETTGFSSFTVERQFRIYYKYVYIQTYTKVVGKPNGKSKERRNGGGLY